MTRHPPISNQRRRRFGRDRSGASAVEFAIVAPVFLSLMFATFEVGWFFFVGATVDSATVDAARQVRTGQVQNQNLTKQQFFEDVVCPRLAFLEDCDSRLTAEVREFPTMQLLAADTSSPTCADENPTTVAAIPYQPGASCAIVRVRICLIYDTLNPALGLSLAQNALGQRKIVSEYLLRVEPFQRPPPGTPPPVCNL
jgi:Flp pilus assembly pilin Flp